MSHPTLTLSLPKFESLTAGTSLPQVSLEDLSPPRSPASSIAASPAAPADSITPPQSPSTSGPTSMRRFLSRVSLNNPTFPGAPPQTAGGETLAGDRSDRMSIFSAGTEKKKKSSWWKKAGGKRMSSLFGGVAEVERSSVTMAPPRLPELGSVGEIDGEVFRNFK